MAAPLVLRLHNITKRFGALTANDDIDLELRRGEVLALLGENGAGKTTLMNILFGHYTADLGNVEVADGEGGLRTLEPGSPAAALEAGIGMVHQHFTLAENLTALENILLGTERVFSLTTGNRRARAKVEKLMAASELSVDLDIKVRALTVGERQRVEILKALYRDVRVLVLDEPTAVLTPQEADDLFLELKRLAADGLGIIFISHKLGEVLAISDRIAVLRGGRKVGELETARADRRAIADLMVGHAVPESRRSPKEPGGPVLELDGITMDRPDERLWLRNISLEVREGEIVGLAGVSGNGQSALAALIGGLTAPDGGTMRLAGETVTRFDPRAFVAARVARIPEDRHHDGVVGAMSVAENVAIEDIRQPDFQRSGFLDFAAIRSRAEAAIKDYDVRCPGPGAAARLLSGGNIQKLILARVLEREPRLILANQPSRGLDVGAQAQVHQRLLAARERGAGVLLISEDLDELFTLSDRIVVIHDGHLAEAGPPEGLDRGTVGLMMAGSTAEHAGASAS